MQILFRNREGRLRAVWEIMAVVAAIITLMAVVSFGLSLRVGSRGLFDPDGWVRVFKSTGLYSFAVVCFTVKVIHKRPLSDIGLSRPDGKQFAAGFAGGALLLTSIVLVLWGMGNASFHSEWLRPSFGGLDAADIVVTVLLAGICEEVLFRGYLQHLLSSRIGVPAAVGITSILFSLAHAANPGYSWISALNIMIIALIFSQVTLRTGKLYAAIALHLSWNLFQGYIYGVAVSGNTPRGLYSVSLSGNELLTGGEFGLEGSLVTTLILIILSAALLLIARNPKSR
ncbi:CPBP family intramembrane glutamic endopeptidase [Paenibacillus sp. MMS20-IR301]|uniref:CPBP family intramembrane glutamic endopeptidase n=1 Tax=Paenibacillus sp. MMS20-IR301 TaxID=2895946 RepID=UPI0028F13A3D|nr:CPBP family intramembrane glutamic endopeptidase [Paenibacillus sp. MMS20-IR301]WNS41436.1 CPBP family intramembrane glutamic endopeptidase [Paenibacillus sp. MMS20-IR301]